jgi:peptidoglycan hydrolase CwlO-like protein
MAYDSNLPANHATVVAQELRDQFNGLKALIDAQQATINTLQGNFNDLQLQTGDNAAAITALQAAVAAL